MKVYKKMLYTTLIGQIVTSIGILLEKSEKDMFAILKRYANEIGDSKEVTVRKIAEDVMSLYGDVTDRRSIIEASLYLFWDERGIYTPQVTILVSGDDVPVGLPLLGNTCTGAVRGFNEGNDWAMAERILDYVDWTIEEE